MIKKIKDWTKKPITWGGYLKLCIMGIVTGLAMVIISMLKTRKELSDFGKAWAEFSSKTEPEETDI